MDIQSLGLAHVLQSFAIASLVLLAYLYIPRINLNAQLRKLPVFGGDRSEKYRIEYLKHAKNMHIDAYVKASSAYSLKLYSC